MGKKDVNIKNYLCVFI